jgi:beta-lactamase class D
MKRFMLLAPVFFTLLLPLSAWCQDSRLAKLFADTHIDGTVVISNLDGSRRYTHNEQRAQTPFIPASTFKVLNTLIALDEGVVSEAEVIKWDGTQHEFAAWNRDQTLDSAFKSSCVWFYQELARRIGAEKYRTYLRTVGYGNALAEPELTTFWLSGDLRITALEQVEFLTRVYTRKLPFKASSYNILSRIMQTEAKPEYSLRAKTGWGARVSPQVGWYVGYLLTKDNTPWFFAMNMTVTQPEDLKFRQQLVMEALRVVGIIR